MAWLDQSQQRNGAESRLVPGGNDGPGIAPEQRKHLFQPFVRATVRALLAARD